MVHFSSSLWPIHYKPLPDELLSCWLVRLAHGHGMKVQTFCNVIFGNHHQVWNRDIDRLAPSWLLSELSNKTYTPMARVLNTTLRSYEGLLYPKFRPAGALQWVLVLQMYHRKRKGYGLQFCPLCLNKDDVPYFRKQWRIALNTVCQLHGTMLLDRCPICSSPVAVHRLDMRMRDFIASEPLSLCHICGFDLRRASTVDKTVLDIKSSDMIFRSCLTLNAPFSEWDLGRYSVLHHICRIMTTRYKHAKLREFVLDQIGESDISLTPGKMSFEMRSIEERHFIIQLGAWILSDLRTRLSDAWRSGSVRYNLLLKDFDSPPIWYLNLVSELSNWRSRNI